MKAYIKEGGHGNHLHRFIAEQALGRSLKEEEQVHHISLDKYDNGHSNLVICPDKKYHSLIHARTLAFLATGNPDDRKCYLCQAWCAPSTMSQVKRRETSARPTAGNYFYHKECALANYYRKKDRINPRRNMLRRKIQAPHKILDADKLLSEI